MTENSEHQKRITGEDVAVALQEMADAYAGMDSHGSEAWEGARSSSFEDDGVLSGNPGFTIRFADGSEFQVSVVRTRQRR